MNLAEFFRRRRRLHAYAHRQRDGHCGNREDREQAPHSLRSLPLVLVVFAARLETSSHLWRSGFCSCVSHVELVGSSASRDERLSDQAAFSGILQAAAEGRMKAVNHMKRILTVLMTASLAMAACDGGVPQPVSSPTAPAP